MTYQEAISILHPDTTLEALSEYEYYGGFNGKEARIKAVEEACVVACEAMKFRIPTKVMKKATNLECYCCPNCKNVVDEFWTFGNQKIRIEKLFCVFCGQALDWSNV